MAVPPEEEEEEEGKKKHPARSATSDDSERLRKEYHQMFDINRDGKVETEEIHTCIDAMKPMPPEDREKLATHVKEVLESGPRPVMPYDKPEQHYAPLHEVITTPARHYDEHNPLKIADQNKDGKITKDELVQAIVDDKSASSNKLVETIQSAYDHNKDGKLDIRELEAAKAQNNIDMDVRHLGALLVNAGVRIDMPTHPDAGAGRPHSPIARSRQDGARQEM